MSADIPQHQPGTKELLLQARSQEQICLQPLPDATGILVLGCGNTLRSDDAVASRILDALETLHPGVATLYAQQWTPEMAEPLSRARLAVFVDCAQDSAPGDVRVQPVEPATGQPHSFTHHVDAAALLRLALDTYGRIPGKAYALTVGAGSLELHEGLTPAVEAAIPSAVTALLQLLVTDCS